MQHHLNRRTVAAILASSLSLGGKRPGDLSGVLSPHDGPPMASAGVIARRADGQMAYRASCGTAHGPKGVVAFGPNAPFRVASVSKMVAALVCVPLIMKSDKGLEADVSGLLGFRLRHPAHPDVPITARMLLSHTGGLRNGPSFPVPFGHRLEEAFLERGRNNDDGDWFGPAVHAPGQWFAYADVNFALIAQMTERLSGQRFDQLMHQALFAPLGLDIGYNWSGVSQAKRDRAAAGLRRVAGQWVSQVDSPPPRAPNVTFSRASDDLRLADYRPGENGFVFSPQGGLRLSLADMDGLARACSLAHHGNNMTPIPSAALRVMQTPDWALDPARANGDTDEGVFQSYGLGMQTPTGRPGPSGDAFFGKGSDRWRGHLGDAYGWMTGLFWNLDDRRTLVWAINGMPETGRPPGLRSALTAPEEALADMALGAS